MSMISTTGVANNEMRPHQLSTSVTKKYWENHLLTQLRQKKPPMRRWKNITMAPICWTKKTLRVGASTPQDWQIMALALPLVPRTRSSHDFPAGTVANFGFKSGTRIIELLVSFSIPKFAQRSLRMLANFGIGTLASGPAYTRNACTG